MKKARLFIENIVVYGIGGIISKIIPLIMVPIVTRIMPRTDYYGISDLSNTIVQLGSALAIMGMYDAMFRLFFEKDDEEYKQRVCSTALSFTLLTSFILFCLMLVCRVQIAELFFHDKRYAYVIYFTAMATLVGATNGIISAPTRMQNKRKVFLITNTVSPLLSYSVAIPLLLRGHYIIALPLAAVISGASMELAFAIMNHKWFKFASLDRETLKQLLIIAIPLLPNFIIYWVFNSCDRVMITNLLGVGAAGVYSVGSKLGSASQLIYVAFAGGWQYFAFSTMKEKGQVESNSQIFEYLGIISFVMTAFVCAISYAIFKMLFTVDYLQGFIVAPYLFLVPLLQMLFQVAINQLLVIKKTWPNPVILATGAIVNIIMNRYLIPKMGIEGASLATLTGYVISLIICCVVLKRMKLLVLSKRFMLVSSMLAVVMLLWRIVFAKKTWLCLAEAIVFTIIVFALYKTEILNIINSIKSGFKTKLNAKD